MNEHTLPLSHCPTQGNRPQKTRKTESSRLSESEKVDVAWQTLGRTLAAPCVELDSEVFAGLLTAVACRRKSGLPVDPVLAGLLTCLSRDAAGEDFVEDDTDDTEPDEIDNADVTIIAGQKLWRVA